MERLEETALVRAWGGQSQALPFVDGYSTTQLVRKVTASSDASRLRPLRPFRIRMWHELRRWLSKRLDGVTISVRCGLQEMATTSLSYCYLGLQEFLSITLDCVMRFFKERCWVVHIRVAVRMLASASALVLYRIVRGYVNIFVAPRHSFEWRGDLFELPLRDQPFWQVNIIVLCLLISHNQ